MKRASDERRRPRLQITLGRASRLHKLVRLLAEGDGTRERILNDLAVGLRTFYRELELLKKCGIKVRQAGKIYDLRSTGIAEAQGRLPFPDPQLNFAEMTELASYPGTAAQRLAKILEGVTHGPEAAKAKPRDRKKAGSRKDPQTEGKKKK